MQQYNVHLLFVPKIDFCISFPVSLISGYQDLKADDKRTSAYFWQMLKGPALISSVLHLCNGWNGQLPLARQNIVVPVCGWIRPFEMRISNYFWYKYVIVGPCFKLPWALRLLHQSSSTP